MAGARVEVEELATGYEPGRVILEGLSLAVAPGEMVALVGANGAGKTTLLRSLVGLTPPVAGRVVVDGTDVGSAGRRELQALRRHTGVVFQRLGLATRLPAFANVLHGAMGRSGPRGWWPATAPQPLRDEAMACLARVGLDERATTRVDQLSGGQRQRVAIARMLMQRPTLVLADEPVASLDPAGGVAIMALLREVAAEQAMTVVVTLHQLEFARRFADRVVGLRSGRVELDQPASCCEASTLDELYATAR